MPNGTTHRMEMKSHKVVADVGNKIPDLYVYSFVGFPNETLEGVYYVLNLCLKKMYCFRMVQISTPSPIKKPADALTRQSTASRVVAVEPETVDS